MCFPGRPSDAATREAAALQLQQSREAAANEERRYQQQQAALEATRLQQVEADRQAAADRNAAIAEENRKTQASNLSQTQQDAARQATGVAALLPAPIAAQAGIPLPNLNVSTPGLESLAQREARKRLQQSQNGTPQTNSIYSN